MLSHMPTSSGSSDEMRMIAMPCRASSAIIACTSDLLSTSMPCVGSSRIRTRGMVASHLDRTTFCWLPPERVFTGWSKSRNFRRNRRRVRFNKLKFAPPHHEAGQRRLSDNGERRVGEDGKLHDQALAQAVLGNIDDAGGHRRGRIGKRNLLSLEPNAACAWLVDAKQHARDLGASAAHQSGEAKDLSGANFEGHVGESFVARQALYRQDFLARRRRAAPDRSRRANVRSSSGPPDRDRAHELAERQ